MKASKMIRQFLRNERGATMVEYGLIIACMSLAILAGFGNFTNAFSELLGEDGPIIDALSSNQ
jgi:pilus assembly protein Flp/PilA